jgi:hypothetical protein
MQYLKVVFNHVTTAMMEQRVELSRELLVTLRSANRRGWTRFIPGDESWF